LYFYGSIEKVNSLKYYNIIAKIGLSIILITQYFQTSFSKDNVYLSKIAALSGDIMILFEIIVLLFLLSIKIKMLSISHINKIIFFLLLLFLILTTFNSKYFLVESIVQVLFWFFVYYIFNVISYMRPDLLTSFNNFFYKFTIFLIFIVIFQAIIYYSSSFQEYVGFNKCYYPLFALPWALSIKGRKKKLFVYLLLLIAILISFKRTISIAFVLASVFYIYISNLVNKRRFIFKNFILIISLITTSYLMYTYIDTLFSHDITKRFSSISMEEKENDRIRIYNEIIYYQNRSTLSEWLLGHGYNSVKKATKFELSAHNDWLEILYDYGLFAFLIYGILNVYLIKYLSYLIKIRSQYAAAFGVSIIIFFVSSLLSTVILVPGHFVLISSFWGAIIGCTEQMKRYNKIS